VNRGNLFFWLWLLPLVFTGCEARLGNFRAKPVTPPSHAIVGVRISNIGINIGTDPVTQMPKLNLGYQAATYMRVPTSTTEVNAPPVRANFGLNTGVTFDTSIDGEFCTGQAAIVPR
jgi:hypothetical protein